MARKIGLEKLEETELAWTTHAADDKFYDMTLAQYRAKIERSREARDLVASLNAQLSAALNTRKTVDAENIEIERNVAKGIAGDARYGEDSDLYEGTGRVRKSERKTGLTRKRSEKAKE